MRNGNQLHPAEGPEHDRVVRDTIQLASRLGVPTVVMMSGLPGARGDSTPNWITTSWPPETLRVLDYQWTEVAIPYWKDLAAFARDKGVRLAIEACGGQLVYNVSTMLRLIDAAGDDVVGANLDPSPPDVDGRRHPHRHPGARVSHFPRARQRHPNPTPPGQP